MSLSFSFCMFQDMEILPSQVRSKETKMSKSQGDQSGLGDSYRKPFILHS